MSRGLSEWWRQRTQREHYLLILLLVVAVPVLLGYGVVRPVQHALAEAQGRRDADAQMLGDVLLMAGRISGAGHVARSAMPIEAQIAKEAERAGFTASSATRDGDGAVLVIDPVRAQPLLGWIAAMKPRGLIVTRLTARPNGDSTLSVTMRFARAH